MEGQIALQPCPLWYGGAGEVAADVQVLRPSTFCGLPLTVVVDAGRQRSPRDEKPADHRIELQPEPTPGWTGSLLWRPTYPQP